MNTADEQLHPLVSPFTDQLGQQARGQGGRSQCRAEYELWRGPLCRTHNEESRFQLPQVHMVDVRNVRPDFSSVCRPPSFLRLDNLIVERSPTGTHGVDHARDVCGRVEHQRCSFDCMQNPWSRDTCADMTALPSFRTLQILSRCKPRSHEDGV